MGKIEFRNLYNKYFGNKAKNGVSGAVNFQLLNRLFASFSPVGAIYDEATARSCIHSIATHCAKLKPQHRKAKKTQNSQLNQLLYLRPNQYMNAFDFIYKIVTQLLCSSNAFVYIKRDGFGEVVGLYPINFSSLRLLDVSGEMFVEFSFATGKKVVLPYTELIHLRRHFNEDDMFGASQRESLKTPLEVLNTINQGIINTIKLSTGLRGLLKFKTVTPPAKQKQIKDDFVESYLDINNADGLATLDPSAEFQELNFNPQTADDRQTTLARENIYRYYNVAEEIVCSKYSEDDYNAFYSSVVEPIALQLSLEFTYKLFSEKELLEGNEVIFSAERMTFASNATKAEVISKLMPLGIFSINQACEIMEMPKIEEEFADKHIISLNYVNAEKADKYQKVDDNNQDKKDTKNDEQPKDEADV